MCLQQGIASQPNPPSREFIIRWCDQGDAKVCLQWHTQGFSTLYPSGEVKQHKLVTLINRHSHFFGHNHSTFHSQVHKSHSPNLSRKKVVRISSIMLFHLSKLWKAKFFMLCDVIILVRLQGKFEINHFRVWKGKGTCYVFYMNNRHGTMKLQLIPQLSAITEFRRILIYLEWQMSAPTCQVHWLPRNCIPLCLGLLPQLPVNGCSGYWPRCSLHPVERPRTNCHGPFSLNSATESLGVAPLLRCRPSDLCRPRRPAGLWGNGLFPVRLTEIEEFNPFTPELKKCILPTFQKAIVWVM